MSYQNIVGTLAANSHPGSYCGQDAYNDLFVTENRRIQRIGCHAYDGTQRLQGCDRFDNLGGTEMSTTAVRRLTPTECELLQGYPKGWTDIGDWVDTSGKVHKQTDSARYKALGNSIALPYWKVLARRISAQYDRDITMGSLFSGIGGFEVAFQHCGGKAVWASEIEEFPIAVTKRHFPEPEDEFAKCMNPPEAH